MCAIIARGKIEILVWQKNWKRIAKARM